MTTAAMTVADDPFGPLFTDPRSARGRWQRPVRVFDHDRRLLAGVDSATRDLARHHGVADSVILDAGRWSPPRQAELGPAPIGLLVLEGLLSRTLSFEGIHSPELLGAGDLLRPWHDEDAALAIQTQWHVLERATVALLDDRFARRMSRFPGVTSALLDRGVQRARWLSAQIAIAHVRRAEPRLLMLFWHLADRWGQVTPRGVALPLRLTHATIAQLACMRRPTVSATLTRLARAGEIRREDDGTWLITGSPPDLSSVVHRGEEQNLRAV